jgi:two-component system nitrogen regulation sensor histidine kinase GlnL
MEPATEYMAVPDYKANAFDLLTTAVVVLDTTQTVRAMNQAAEDLFGVSERRAVGGSLRDYLMNDGSLEFGDLTDLFQSREPVTRRGAVFRMRDGQRIKADLTISYDTIGGASIIELTPMNRLLRINREEQVLSSQKTIQELTRGLAHEIKNPLGGLRGAAQLLDREFKESPELREYTNVIIQEADRLRDLVDTMLGPNQQPKLQAVNVHQILEHVVRLIYAEFPGQVVFQRDYDPSVPDLYADEDRLIQATLNMMRNAVQVFVETQTVNPTITLRTRIVRLFTIGNTLHRLVAQIDIIDNGPGIPEDMQDKVFLPMITGRADGTGLGLAITQNIITQHRGMIECDSEPGETCFSIFLPLETRVDE